MAKIFFCPQKKKKFQGLKQKKSPLRNHVKRITIFDIISMTSWVKFSETLKIIQTKVFVWANNFCMKKRNLGNA